MFSLRGNGLDQVQQKPKEKKKKKKKDQMYNLIIRFNGGIQ